MKGSRKGASRIGRFGAKAVASLQRRRRVEQGDFSRLVRLEAARCILSVLEQDKLTVEQRRSIESEFRNRLGDVSAEHRSQALDEALRSGDWSTVAALFSAGSLVGVGLAVEIAGFSAYIAAAQASAIIPLLGGKTAVSLLAVVSNPLFILPAVVGGTYLINRRFDTSIGRSAACRLVIVLALQGLASCTDGLKQCLDDFKKLADEQVAQEVLVGRRNRTKEIMCGSLQETPGELDSDLPAIAESRGNSVLSAVLFPNVRSSVGDAAVVGGLTAADVVFNAVAIDPAVISAVDFSRVTNVDDVFEFGAFAARFEAMDPSSQAGLENSLRGFVAEAMVATRLRDHDVSFPDIPNSPGFDLIVDGIPFQVKCYRDGDVAVRALREHFERYPDIPVYVNREVLPVISEVNESWVNSVFSVEGFDYETTEEVVKTSLEAGADLMELHVPVFAIAVSAAKNVHGWWRGSVSLRDLPLEVAVDGAVHGTLTAFGGFTGVTIGMLLFGPAGAVVFGGTGGVVAVLGASKVRQEIDERFSGDWIADVGTTADRFRAALVRAMHAKLERIRLKVTRVGSPDEALVEWIHLRFEDQALGVAECIAELDDLPTHSIDRSRELLRLMRESGVHPWSVREELKELLDLLAERPSVTEQVGGAPRKAAKWLGDQGTTLGGLR